MSGSLGGDRSSRRARWMETPEEAAALAGGEMKPENVVIPVYNCAFCGAEARGGYLLLRHAWIAHEEEVLACIAKR